MTISPDLPGLATDTRDVAYRRLAFLAETTALITGSLDQRTVLRQIARRLVPEWADWCMIDVTRGDGSVERVAVMHADPTGVALAHELERHPPTPADHPALRAIRDGEGVIFSEIDDDTLRAIAAGDAHLEAMRAVQPRSALAAPLTARGRTIGALTLVSTHVDRRYTEEDLRFAEEVGRRAALAVDGARLFGEVQDAERRYRALVQNIDAVVWEASPEPFRLRFVSPRVEAMLGYPVEAWKSDPDIGLRVLHPEDAEAVADVFRAAITEGKSGELDYRIRHADGRWIWVRAAMFVEKDEEGKPTIIRGLVSDITARKKAELHERAQAAVDHVLVTAGNADQVPPGVLRALCEILGWNYGALWEVRSDETVLRYVGGWTSDPDTLSDFSRASASMHFTLGQGLPGQVWLSREPAWLADLTAAPNFPRAALASRVGFMSGVGFPIIARGRVLGVMEFFSREPRERDEEVLSLMTTIGTEIGQFFERQHVEEALRDSEVRTRTIIESSLDAVVTIDHEGTLIEFNAAAENMFGYTRDDVIGRKMADVLVPPSLREGHRRGFSRYMATGQAKILNTRLEMRAMRSDRSEFPVELAITRVDISGPPLFTGYIRDITERASSERRRDAHQAITRLLSEELTTEEAAARVLEEIGSSTDWTAAVLWVLPPQAKVLRPAASWSGRTSESFIGSTSDTTVAKSEGVAGRVWEARRPLWFSDLAAEGIPAGSEGEMRAAVGSPIMSGSDVLGVLELLHADVQQPDADLIAMLGSIGTQFAQFIIRRATEDAQRFQKAILESQNEATIDGIVITSPGGAIRSFNRRFVELFGIPEDLTAPDDTTELAEFVMSRFADRDRFLERAIALHRDPGLAEREEMRLVDGRVLDRYTAPLRSEDGEVYGRAWYYRDISDRKRAETALAANNQRFAFLAEASTVLGGSLDLDQTLQTLTQISVPYIADVCVVDLVETDGTLRQVALHASDPNLREAVEKRSLRRYGADASTGGGVMKVLRSGVSQMGPADAESWLSLDGAVDGQSFRSYMCVPLVARGQILGAITFMTSGSGRTYGPADLALAEDLARRAALAVDNARLFSERENVARTLQDSLLPPTLPEIPGCEVGAAFHFAGKGSDVGGDFYDLFDTGDDEWAFVIGDVCGKGAPAAALTALSRYTLRAAAMQARKPNRVLGLLNEAILRQSSERFCTVAYARLAGSAGESSRRLTVACGGHPSPLILRADGTVEPIGTAGSLLGVFPDPILSDVSTTLDRGDALILYTDGVTEARDQEGELGEEGLQRLVEGCAGLDAAAIAARVGRYAIDFQNGEPRDDIAVVVVRIA